MKLNMKYVIFGCVLLLVILLTMATSCGAMPYSASKRSYALFEGFDVDELKREFDSNLTYFLKTLSSKSGSIDNEFMEDETTMIEKIRKNKNYDVKMIEKQLIIPRVQSNGTNKSLEYMFPYINDEELQKDLNIL